MAATRLIPLHICKNWNIKNCLRARVKYAINPEKTENEELVTSYACTVHTASEEFLLSHSLYEARARRHYDHEIIAYQIRQSFKPGEVTAEEANRIGYETAMKFTKGNHAFIVATHTDRAHIHNHVIINSVNLSETAKFKNHFLSAFTLQRISDFICLENGLSVIKPRPYRERDNIVVYPKKATVRDEIRLAIDAALAKQPHSYDEFLQRLREQGYEVKTGKHTAVRSKNHKRFIRFRTLGKGYTQEDIAIKLEGIAKAPVKNHSIKPQSADEKFDLLLSLEDIIRKGKGKGYEVWAKKYNLKNLMKALLFLQEKGVNSYEELVRLTENSSSRFDELSERIKTDERRLKEIHELKNHIINYSKTRDVYVKYRENGYSRKFFEANREAIQIHKAAKDAFQNLGMKKIPKVKELNEEYQKLLSDKRSTYEEYKQVRADMQKYQIAKYDVEKILNMDRHEQYKKKEQEYIL
ncbi:MAG: relaxase/mobilization nuclease domain-containing protein [Lachnospiraceae bacterium]|nr:relaxase/mobilization nuclease domain-containing protein [Lachnospiraceae bacterium]